MDGETLALKHSAYIPLPKIFLGQSLPESVEKHEIMEGGPIEGLFWGVVLRITPINCFVLFPGVPAALPRGWPTIDLIYTYPRLVSTVLFTALIRPLEELLD